jgi:EmrB/QacA subfamily drug resistance transporter
VSAVDGNHPTTDATRGAGAGTHPDAIGEPHPRRHLIYAIISIALFMAAVDQSIVATALPAIEGELHAQINWSGWTITIYALGQVLAMPIAGKLSDQFGRKKVFLGCVVAFTITSLACGFADNIVTLVVLRALQALGCGGILPSATGIVADHFGRQRDRALAMFASIFPIGGITGPLVGSVLVTTLSWRAIFLVNVPIGIVLLGLAVKIIPPSDTRVSDRIDLRGIGLFAGLILSAMFGVSYLGSGSTTPLSPVFGVCVVIALTMGWLFLRHSQQHPAPFIPFHLLRGRGFAVMHLINFLFGAAVLGLSTLTPVYAEDRFQIVALEAGILLTARAVGMISVAALAVLALRRTGYRLPMLVGYSLVAVGLLIMAAPPPLLTPFHWLMIGICITGIGMGLSNPASNNASLQLAPDSAAAIAGLRGMFRQSGAIASVSITTAIIARSADPGHAQAHVLLAFAVVTILTMPLIFLVPEHRGSW